MLTILDYGSGNVESLVNMLKRIDVPAAVARTAKEAEAATKFILPGVGHFDYCMAGFRRSDLFETVEKKVLQENIPILGICVGCQMLVESSEEGREKGLGWIAGKVIRFQPEKMAASDKVPHMGWTDIEPRPGASLFAGLTEPRFYFAHSYHLSQVDEEQVAASVHYGYSFPAGVSRGNILGVQFHPEKSHKFGMQVLKNFAKL